MVIHLKKNLSRNGCRKKIKDMRKFLIWSSKHHNNLQKYLSTFMKKKKIIHLCSGNSNSTVTTEAGA